MIESLKNEITCPCITGTVLKQKIAAWFHWQKGMGNMALIAIHSGFLIKMLTALRTAGPKAAWPATIVLLSFALLSTAAAAAEKWNDPHDYYATIAENRGDLLRNVEKFHLPQGIDKMRNKRFEPAWADFDFVLRYYPNHPRALLLISDLALRMKRPGDAEKYLNKAITLYPQYASTHVIYGIFLQKAGRLDDAILHYEDALRLEPNASETHYNLGLALFKKGDQDGALKHAKRAYQLGYPLPGLRNKLIKAGKWQSSDPASHQPAAQAESSK